MHALHTAPLKHAFKVCIKWTFMNTHTHTHDGWNWNVWIKPRGSTLVIGFTCRERSMYELRYKSTTPFPSPPCPCTTNPLSPASLEWALELFTPVNFPDVLSSLTWRSFTSLPNSSSDRTSSLRTLHPLSACLGVVINLYLYYCRLITVNVRDRWSSWANNGEWNTADSIFKRRRIILQCSASSMWYESYLLLLRE